MLNVLELKSWSNSPPNSIQNEWDGYVSFSILKCCIRWLPVDF